MSLLIRRLEIYKIKKNNNFDNIEKKFLKVELANGPALWALEKIFVSIGKTIKYIKEDDKKVEVIIKISVKFERFGKKEKLIREIHIIIKIIAEWFIILSLILFSFNFELIKIKINPEIEVIMVNDEIVSRLFVVAKIYNGQIKNSLADENLNKDKFIKFLISVSCLKNFLIVIGLCSGLVIIFEI